MGQQDTEQVVPAEIAHRLQTTGASAAGGAGFPSYVKWQDLDDIQYLLLTSSHE